jgi:hypothetical protein
MQALACGWSASGGWKMVSILLAAMMLRALAGEWIASVGWKKVSVGCQRR